MSGVNVLRYSALAFGVFYGISHQAAITAASKSKAITQEYERKENLIQKAKAEYTRKTMPAKSKTASGGVISDPEDPNFDFEAWVNVVAAEKAT